MNREEFAKELRMRMMKLDLTQQDVADRLGVTRSYVNGLITGRFNIGRKTARKLGEILNVSPVWLVSQGDGDMFEESGVKAENRDRLNEKIDLLETQIEIIRNIIDSIKTEL